VVVYGYDATGNRTSITINSVTTTNTFDAGDRLTSSDSGAVPYGYDDHGNLTSRTEGGVTTSYGYDSLNRLTSVTGGTSYSYNGDGLRVSKTVSSSTTPFTWDPSGIGTLLSDGDDYLWGNGLIGRIDASSDITYAHQDGLGSIRLITDDTGAVVGTTEYDAFGAQRATTGVQYRLGYTGEQLDAETGFVYLRARYYDPGQGRFLTKDPWPGRTGDPPSLHRYAYVSNGPINYSDPTGACLAADVSIAGNGKCSGAGAIGWGLSVNGARGLGILAALAAALDKAIGRTSTDAQPRTRDDQEEYITVYRVWGGGSQEWGYFWTQQDPRTALPPGFRSRAGLPNANAGTCLTIGRVQRKHTVDLGLAPGIETGQLGGWPQIGIPLAQVHVQKQGTTIAVDPTMWE
jgi:RHS repeat-associated protein